MKRGDLPPGVSGSDLPGTGPDARKHEKEVECLQAELEALPEEKQEKLADEMGWDIADVKHDLRERPDRLAWDMADQFDRVEEATRLVSNL